MSRTPVRLSLLRRIPWLGADRRVVGSFGIACAALGWTMFRGFGLLYGLFIAVPSGIFMGVLWIAREMHSADPWMFDVLLRHFRYGKYCAPKSSRGKQRPQIRDFTRKPKWR